jgi:hypothetical protein
MLTHDLTESMVLDGVAFEYDLTILLGVTKSWG